MFVDEAEITVQAGTGGAGFVAFFGRRGGPCGGNGGNGGSVYAQVNQNMSNLKRYVEHKKFKAEDGQSGGYNRSLGANGVDLILYMPVGTSVINLETNEEIELNNTKNQILLCRGGNYGRGNDAFKTSTNRTPRNRELGFPGQTRHFKLLLKLIANFGLIGLPNAGKSSLLNVLTAANVKTANYPFTTLEASLGAYNGKIIADIPGLIEGASKGKGLGIKFLKHVEKVRLLLHCLSVESENLEKDYQTILDEMGAYNKTLLNKDTVILLTKIDLISPKEVQQKIKLLKKFKKQILPISIYNKPSLKKLELQLNV